MDLAANPDASPQVRASATKGLRDIQEFIALKLKERPSPVLQPELVTHLRATQDDVERFLARPEEPRRRTPPLPRPPGDPIGSSSQTP
jgi:hypothetical protein